MSALTHMHLRPSDGNANTDQVILDPVRMTPDSVEYISRDENPYDRLTCTWSLRHAPQPGGNHKVTGRVRIPVGAAYEDASGRTTRKYSQVDISFIFPDDTTESERAAVKLAALEDLMRKQDGISNPDLIDIINKQRLPLS